MKRILTGDRTSGKLHLGHYVGSLKNRVKLQDEHETFVMEADVQTLTDNFASPEKVRESVFECAMDNLAVGLDPKKSTLFIQSQIPEISELCLYFMNLVSLARVQRNPTVKTEIAQKGFGEEVPFGFINYPVSQAADILAFKANLVPVGEDQSPMIELTREIARRFNNIYGAVFQEPEILVGEVARLVGIDGNAKMSKSLNNAIYLSDEETEVTKKVMNMYTDPARIKSSDPGHVEGNPLFIYLDAFGESQDQGAIQDFKERYVRGTVGDVEVKKYLADLLNRILEPIRQKRKDYENNPELVAKILMEGTQKAREEVSKIMKEVKKAMKLDYFS
jgi:tryptophanyl-tRNA synthetase